MGAEQFSEHIKTKWDKYASLNMANILDCVSAKPLSKPIQTYCPY